MSSFTDILIVSPLSDGERWVVRKEFSYYLDDDNEDSEKIVVPTGYVTDFASVPRAFWKIVPKWGKYGSAAVIHDYLYDTQKKSRKESDKIFLNGMRILGVPKWKRYGMYWSVRIFGFFSYGDPPTFIDHEVFMEEIYSMDLKNR